MFEFITWNVWTWRWHGLNIIESLMKRMRTRWFGFTGTPSFGGLYSLPLTGQVYPFTGPVSRASITWSGALAARVTSGVGDNVAVSRGASLRTDPTKSSTLTVLGALLTRMFSWAWPCLSSGTATTGSDSFTVTIASTRSPMPRITEFACTGTTG